MTLLRIHGSLLEPPQHCQWAFIAGDAKPVRGEGALAALPRHAGRVQFVVPAAQVLLTRARVPRAARRGAGSTLAFAVEERTAGEPDANQVSWLGAGDQGDALAVIDKPGLKRWRDALAAAGIHGFEVNCETLMLPWTAGEWSLAWNGREGFVRSGEFEGAATDCGERETPPLSLRLMLEEAQARGTRPASIALYAGSTVSTGSATSPGATPDIEAWTRELGVGLRLAGNWDWRSAPADAGISLAQERQRWRVLSGTVARLRPAAWLLATALAVHAAALVADWASLANQQRALRGQLESRFRATFPDAVAVTDPALQMRRKLAQARHAAGQPDQGDFLPMVERVAAAAKDLPPGAVRILSYEAGRMTLELAGVDGAVMQRISTRLTQAGMGVEVTGTKFIAVRPL